MKNAQEFYSDCIEEFHKAAKEKGVANKGLIFIPELIPIGQKVILDFLNDGFFQSQFGNNPQKYYYFIFSLCVDSGIDIATKWHKDFANINTYVDEMLEDGPVDDANEIMAKYLPNIAENQGNPFFSHIFNKWLQLHQPYWDLIDPRNYTFNAMLAGYQLGISMILEKYGY